MESKNHFARKCSRKVQRVSLESAANDDTYVTHDEEGLIGTMTHQICGLTTSPRAKLRIQGRTKAFLLDTGASANMISSHDIDIRKLKLTTPGRKFTMWNGATQQTIGRACIPVYNPVNQKTYNIHFDVVTPKLTPILGCSTIQAMGLVQVNVEQYKGVSNVQPMLDNKEDYIKAYSEVFKRDLGTLEGNVSLQINPEITPTVLPRQEGANCTEGTGTTGAEKAATDEGNHTGDHTHGLGVANSHGTQAG